MKLTLYQIGLVIFALYILIDRTVKFVKKETRQTLFKYLSTVILWIVLTVIAVFPRSSHYLSDKLGRGDNVNTLIYIGFIVVFAVIFKLLAIIERLERNITEIVRKEALREFKK